MKVTINREEKEPEVKIPRLMENKTSGAIFWQVSEKWAVCIESGRIPNLNPGDQIIINPSGYTPFTGTITLSNE